MLSYNNFFKKEKKKNLVIVVEPRVFTFDSFYVLINVQNLVGLSLGKKTNS